MINENNVVTMEKSDLKNLTVDSVKFDASLVSHIVKIERIQKALESEIKKYKEIAKKQDISGNKLVTIENRPANTFDKDEFISVYGQAEYDRFCHMKDKLYVTFG